MEHTLAVNEKMKNRQSCTPSVFIVELQTHSAVWVCIPTSPREYQGTLKSRESLRRNFASDLGNISTDHPSKLKSSYE